MIYNYIIGGTTAAAVITAEGDGGDGRFLISGLFGGGSLG